MKTCNCNKPCGCGENVFSQNSSCSGYPSCEGGEKCSESLDGACVVYTGEEIVNITVPKGAKFNEIVQRMVGAITNPGCNYPDSPCLSPIVGLKKVTNSTIEVEWGSTGAATYKIYYRKEGVTNWTASSATTELSGTIAGLLANTTYQVRVLGSCSALLSCYSVTLSITTKS
jgi:hypothetical protein